MSLTTLRAMRMERLKPSGPIQIIVGAHQGGMVDSESTVYINNASEPRLMDFRPIVGLQFILYQFGDCGLFALSVLDSVVAAGGKCLAVSLPSGVQIPVKFEKPRDGLMLAHWISQERAALCQ